MRISFPQPFDLPPQNEPRETWPVTAGTRPGGFSSLLAHVTQLNESQQGPGLGPELTTRKTFNTANHSIDLQHYQLLVCCSVDFQDFLV